MQLGAISLLALGVVLACDGGNPPTEPEAPAAAERAPTESALAEEPAPSPTEPPEPAEPDPLSLDGSHSTSIGSTAEGRLEGGVALPLEGKGIRHNPKRNPERRYGTVELIQALMRAAAEVDEALPGSAVTINDIANKNGGPVPGHASHRSGRDVDVLFYLLDEDGKPRDGHPIPLDTKGKGTDYKDLADPKDDVPVQIDIPRTWRFAQALVLDPDSHVQRIFVVEHIRSMLLRHARKIKAPKKAIQRFGDLTCQPLFPHDDHFHIRVFCSVEDIGKGCKEGRPMFPWHKQELAKAGVEAVMAGRRKGKRPKLRSPQEARKKAGPMHKDVVEFLDRRETWLKKPHPGRKFCR